MDEGRTDAGGPVRGAVGQVIKFLMVAAMVVLCVLVFVNVVLRYGFNSNLLLTEEVARYVFVWLTFLGAILAYARNGHIRVDSGLRLLPPNPRRIVEFAADAIILVCCYLVTRGSIELAQLNTMNYLPITGLPVSILYFAGVPFGLCIAGLTIRNAWRRMRGAPGSDAP
jgi:TRAP-type C4-dicarboxylate transport system permease small subunit